MAADAEERAEEEVWKAASLTCDGITDGWTEIMDLGIGTGVDVDGWERLIEAVAIESLERTRSKGYVVPADTRKCTMLVRPTRINLGDMKFAKA